MNLSARTARIACSGLAVLLLAAAGPTARAQAPHPVAARLQRLLDAEDARALGPDGLQPLLAGLTDGDTLIRRLAVRAIGRLQRPALVSDLIPALDDALPAVRAEAAGAIAQSVRHLRRAAAGDPSRRLAEQGEHALLAALTTETDAGVVDAMAEAAGRLPFADSTSARAAERAIRMRAGPRPGIGALHAFHTLALARRQLGDLSAETVALLRSAATDAPDSLARRLAVLTLGVSSALDSATTLAASRDRDDQVRRLALGGLGTLAPAERAALLERALRDPGVVVRVNAVALMRSAVLAQCSRFVAATGDSHPYVSLMALDSLGAPCPARAVRAALLRVLQRPRTGLPQHSWQAPAHALVSLARVDPAAAAPFIARFAAATRFQERLYAARAAMSAGNATLLAHLAGDRDDNVREAAVVGLFQLRKHAADSIFIAVLRSRGNQAVLAAAQALGGSRDSRTVPALLDAMFRLSAQKSENARDPRLMILRRVGELGGARDSLRLVPYLADFDTTVAATAATLLSRWTGRPVSARPRPLPRPSEPLAELFLRPDTRLRVTLSPGSGGGSFVVRLFPRDAPATVARVIRLARTHFYDGGEFQRVEPNFVIQGGGPGASEYIGDSRFMRDELAGRSHLRGTIGISSRGRDTGDAQWFINLADNPLLDHEYTVFGQIISGREVAERVLEGDAIARIDVLGAL